MEAKEAGAGAVGKEEARKEERGRATTQGRQETHGFLCYELYSRSRDGRMGFVGLVGTSMLQLLGLTGRRGQAPLPCPWCAVPLNWEQVFTPGVILPVAHGAGRSASGSFRRRLRGRGSAP